MERRRRECGGGGAGGKRKKGGAYQEYIGSLVSFHWREESLCVCLLPCDAGGLRDGARVEMEEEKQKHAKTTRGHFVQPSLIIIFIITLTTLFLYLLVM